MAFDPTRDLARFSRYSGGVRVMEYGADGLEEVGHYVHEEGNDSLGHRLRT